MLDIMSLIKDTNIKESKCLGRIAQNGQNKMYEYLSGADDNSTYSAQNIKYIMELQGDLDWNKITDKTNALFSIGYSDQGNIIGLLTNTNALLQDMLIYSPLEQAKKNLVEVLSLDVGTEAIIGRRYAVNGQSPLTLSLPLVTRSHYKTMSVVIHREHTEKFKEILKTLDVNALTEEDMILIAKDLGFISRTQELAIDVAKDKTIEIVDTSEWVKNGTKPANYWLAKQDNKEGWYAEDNLSSILSAKKENKVLPDFNITANIPDKVKNKVEREVATSESLAREVLVKATKDYFNNNYKEMLLYAKETDLNSKAKFAANNNLELRKSIKQVLFAYRSYMIDNIPEGDMEDKDTAMLARKISREKTTAFAEKCRNTIYKLGETMGIDAYNLSLVALGTDLLDVSKDEGKFFRAVMPEEFKKLYAAGKQAVFNEPLFYVDEFVKDDIDDEIEIIVDFKNGQAFDENGIMIAKASYKYNAEKATIVFDNGRYYAQTKSKVELPPVGDEIIVQIENIDQYTIDEINNTGLDLTYTPKSPNNFNLIYEMDLNQVMVRGSLGYNRMLPLCHKVMLLNNKIANQYIRTGMTDELFTMLNEYDTVVRYKFNNTIHLKEIIRVNENSEYQADYAIIKL